MMTLLQAWRRARVTFPSIEKPTHIDLPDYEDEDDE